MATLETALITEINVSDFFLPIDSFFTTAGWVNTSDTGQAASGHLGYRIWALNDALQSTNPWYLKATYVNGIGGEPGIQWQFSNSTDGAGNLNGSRISTLYGVGIPINNGGYVLENCYLSGSTSRMAYNLWDGPSSFWSLNLGVERTKDTSGNDTADGLIIYYRQFGANGGSYANAGVQLLPDPSFGPPSDAMSQWPSAVNNQQGTMATGTKVGVGYIIPFNVRPLNHGMNFLTYMSSDLPAYSIQTLSVYGATHSYLVCTPNTGSPTVGSYYTHVLMRYE